MNELIQAAERLSSELLRFEKEVERLAAWADFPPHLFTDLSLALSDAKHGSPVGFVPGRQVVFGDPPPPASSPPNKYRRQLSNAVLLKGWMDVYDVCDLFIVECPSAGLQQALKKILMCGKRGAKGREQDLREAIQAVERVIQIEAGA